MLSHKIINIFGSEVTSNNKLNIKKLAEVAFSNKVDQNILNGIMKQLDIHQLSNIKEAIGSDLKWVD